MKRLWQSWYARPPWSVNAVYFQIWVDVFLYAVYGLQELCHAFCREIVCLYGNDSAVCCGKRVDGNHTEAWHTVDEDIIVFVFHFA